MPNIIMIKPISKSNTKQRNLPPPQPTPPPPQPAPILSKNKENVHLSTTPGFFGSLIQGFGLGMGSSLGHRTIDNVFGSSTPDISLTKPSKNSDDKCSKLLELYDNCIKNQKEDCHNYYNHFIQCSNDTN